jgi:uncharacterized protein (DUF2235 family)
MRGEDTKEEKKKKRALFEFMERFRETFSRPIDRIKFVGLFDCVNSVPQFESAWMSRTKFPYTAKTSYVQEARTVLLEEIWMLTVPVRALVIRHAVSIDERRAKFRQDLISGRRSTKDEHAHLHDVWHHHAADAVDAPQEPQSPDTQRSPTSRQFRFRPRSRSRSLKPVASGTSMNDASSSASMASFDSGTRARERRIEDVEDPNDASILDEDSQDILEVWFAGQHGDIGGGWTVGPDEQRPASDLPLIWCVGDGGLCKLRVMIIANLCP